MGTPKARKQAGGLALNPKALDPPSTTNSRPRFDFASADHRSGEPWALAPLSDVAPELVRFLCDISRSTWGEIEAQETGGRRRHKRHHSQGVSSICSSAQARLAALKYDTVFGDEIFRFRLTGTQRLWGFRRADVFHAIWWDPDHLVCPSEVE